MPNGPTTAERGEDVRELLAAARTGNTGDAVVVPLLAGIARQFGRDDLATWISHWNGRVEHALHPPAGPIEVGTAPPTEAVKLVDRGIDALRTGSLSEAESSLLDAVRLAPRHAPAAGNLGVVLARLGRHLDAATMFETAARLDPTDSAWPRNLATARLDLGDPAGAERWAAETVRLDPAAADHHRLLGACLERQGKVERAAAAYATAVKLAPDHPEVHLAHARVLERLERLVDAEDAYRHAVRVAPGRFAGWFGMANLLSRAGRFADSEPAAREAVRIDPRSVDALNLLGLALAFLDRPEESIECFENALKLRPDFVASHSNLANALRTLGRLPEAEASARESIRLRPQETDGHVALGAILLDHGRLDEALSCFETAVSLKPDSAEARVNRSLARLTRGDFDAGWPDYRWRWRLPGIRPPASPSPLWDGSPLEGRTILLLAEQGLGDTLQFVRYAAAVKARGAGAVIAAVPPTAAALVRTCPGVDRVAPTGSPMPHADLYVPMLDLPGHLGIDFRPARPYLSPEAARVSHWRHELGSARKKVGLAWQGNRKHRGDRQRSIPLARFRPILEIPGIDWIGLQKGDGAEQLDSLPFPIRNLGKDLGDGLEDAAAAIRALDLVVTIDSAIAHLAGAVGASVWVLVPFAADWRWGRSGNRTHWYESMELIRQPKFGDWDTTFSRLREKILEWANSYEAKLR